MFHKISLSRVIENKGAIYACRRPRFTTSSAPFLFPSPSSSPVFFHFPPSHYAKLLFLVLLPFNPNLLNWSVSNVIPKA